MPRGIDVQQHNEPYFSMEKADLPNTREWTAIDVLLLDSVSARLMSETESTGSSDDDDNLNSSHHQIVTTDQFPTTPIIDPSVAFGEVKESDLPLTPVEDNENAWTCITAFLESQSSLQQQRISVIANFVAPFLNAGDLQVMGMVSKQLLQASGNTALPAWKTLDLRKWPFWAYYTDLAGELGLLLQLIALLDRPCQTMFGSLIR